MALLFHTVHTLPILNFQPADPTCGQAMCGVELVAPTPLVAALTERLLGLRCQVTRSSCSGLGSHQNPSSSWWGPGRSAASRSQKASQKKSWVTKSVSTKTLRGNVFFPSPVPLPFLIFFSHKRCANAAPLACRSQAADCSLVLLVFVTSKAAMPPNWVGWSRWLPCLDLWSGDPPNISYVRFIKINPQEGG